MTRVPFRDLVQRYFGALESVDVPYLAYGGIAVAVWGNPRETQDADALVEVAPQDAASLLGELGRAGFDHTCHQVEMFAIDGWIRLDFRGRHADLAVARTPFDGSALDRRSRITLCDTEMWIVSAEDLILYKLIAYRFKDLADAESVILRRGGDLDLDYLRQWALEIATHTHKFEVPQKLEQLLAGR